MKTKAYTFLFALVILLMSSCATILSKNAYPIAIRSTPLEARFVIKDKYGKEVYTGVTPDVVTLNASFGYMKKASYQVKFMLDGYEEATMPIEFKVDGWYYGNIFLTSLIGLLIVDPKTGAMYTLKTKGINKTLRPISTGSIGASLELYDINDIPESWCAELLPIKQ